MVNNKVNKIQRAARLTREQRRTQIVVQARHLSQTVGLYAWFLGDVAEACMISIHGVRYHFNSIRILRAEVIRQACENHERGIIQQALAGGDPQAIAYERDQQSC
jgi:hypothetical protein